ncbi:type IX secretion system membrane protein PorP/SprF [bacterium]|nr:type IX secretion system membrane protein PorP/SprF [bacterium]
MGRELKIIITGIAALVLIHVNLSATPFFSENIFSSKYFYYDYESSGGSLLSFPYLASIPDAVNFGIGTPGCMFGNDATVAFYNPGAMILLDTKVNLGMSFSSRMPGISPYDIEQYTMFANYNGDDYFLGELGSFGIGFQSVSNIYSGDLLTEPVGPDSWELGLLLSYAYPLIYGIEHKLGLGFSGKFFHSDLEPASILIGESPDRDARNGFGLDLGLAYSYQKKELSYAYGVKAGLSFTNIGPKYKYYNSNENYPLPATFRFGIGFSYSEYYRSLCIIKLEPQLAISKSLINMWDDPALKEWHEAEKTIGIGVSLLEIIRLHAGYIIDYDYTLKDTDYYGPGSQDDGYDPDYWESKNIVIYGVGLEFSKKMLEFMPFTLRIDFSHVLNEPGDDWALNLVVQ